MKKAKLWSVIILSALLTGCGGAGSDKETAMNTTATDGYNYNMTEDVMYEESAEEYKGEYTEASPEEVNQESESGVSSDGAGTAVVSTARKLIRKVDMELETLEYEKTMEYIENSVNEAGGYIESSSMEGKSIYSHRGNRYSSLKMRIPKEKADAFLAGLDEKTTVRSKSETTEDVTLQYVDVESHKKALQVEQERLMAILEQATTVEEILTLESRLSEVRYEIQNYESRLRTYDNLVDYTTINLDVYEVEEITEEPKETDLERMVDGFIDSVMDVLHGIKEFIIGFVIFIPYLVVYGVIGGIIVLIIKSIKKRRRNKKNQEEQK